MTICGIVLAGGQGLRMGGRDKAALVLGGQTLLARVAGRLAPQVAALAVSSNAELPPPLPGLPAGLPPLALLPDDLPEGVAAQPGPLGGILAGLDWVAGRGADWLLSAPVDTPFLPRDLAARLLATAAGARVPVLAESAGRLHPVAGLWPVDLRAALRAALAGGERRVARWAESHGARRCAFAGEGAADPFLNLNAPADLALAEAILCGRPGPGPEAGA